MDRQKLDTAFSGVLAAAMVLLVAMYGFRTFGPRPTGPGPRPPPRFTSEPEWRTYAARGERLGAANAKVVITEFSDFKCPYCRRFKRTMDTILARYPNDVALVYRHFPIATLHPSAPAAAYASVCAAKQNRFPAFYNLAFEQQDSVGKVPWTTLATRAGVGDTVAFARCMKDSTLLSDVRDDRADGKKLQVSGTPTVLVNQWRVTGTPNVTTLDSLIRQELGKSKK